MEEPRRFSRSFFQSPWVVTRIGTGALGGKGEGLRKAAESLKKTFGDGPFRGIEVNIPRMTVIGTDVFDAFLERNNLRELIQDEPSDARISNAFQRASLPAEWAGDLRALAREVHLPLAVRSSSLLEDDMYQPFAGVYGTKMVPNNWPGADERFRKLTEAVKFVYATTFFKEAIDYQRSVGADPQKEKMGVIIQEVIGQRRGKRFYPTISGVARSHNFYPSGNTKPEDGVVALALGLGKTIVDGEFVWSFSPASPKKTPPFKSRADMMRFTQRLFWTVNMDQPPSRDPMKETEYLLQANLEEAEYDDSLRFVASTYLAEFDRFVPATNVPGPRIVNFGPILEFEEVPLNDLIKRILDLCKKKFESDVEIEFAADLDTKHGVPARFGFLQVRPMMVSSDCIRLEPEDMTGPKVLISSEHVLGNGARSDIQDIVFVPPGVFESKHASRIAADLEKINAGLHGCPYLLVGIGRWGTTDPFCGIPVTWNQISGARVLVEATLPDVSLDPSQGSHFFHNLTSLKVFYFSVRQNQSQMIDWDWLNRQPCTTKGDFARHIHLDVPLAIRVDGRTFRGVIEHSKD